MEMNRNSDSGTDESPENIFALSLPKGEESFPMLKAFQEFLDAERERARRRQMVLTLAFMSAIVMLVVLFCVIGAILFSGMIQRNDTKQDKLLEMLLMDRKAATPATVVEPVRVRQDAVVDEVMELVKQLRAETEALKIAALQAAEPPPEIEAPELKAEPADVKPEPPPKRTGIFSSPKRKSEPPPPLVEADAVDAESPPVREEAVEEAELEKKPEPVRAQTRDDGLVSVKIVPSRVMLPPAGYDAEEIAIVTEDNIRYPWRILTPAATPELMEDE